MSQVLVIGNSIPAYVAALDLAELGIGVRIAPGTVVTPAGPVADATGEVTELLERIASPIVPDGKTYEGAEPVRTEPSRACLLGRDGSWKPQPVPHVWGAPAVPISTDAVGVLGAGGAFRAYLDRLKPVLTIGKQPRLGVLIESRIGAGARERLTEPFIFERFGVRSADVDVAIAAPGLNESLTITGSLSGAVLQYAERLVARETQVAPAAGWGAFVELLLARLSHYGAEQLEESIVKLEVDESGVWIATDESGRARGYSAVIVGDTESVPLESELRAELAAFEPQSVRAYAEIGIQAPVAAQGALVDSAGEEVQELLALVKAADGTPWSVRAVPHGDGTWAARLAGPATDAATALSRSECVQLLQTAGFESQGEDFAVRHEPAPFAALSARDDSESRLAAWDEERETIMLAGERFHRGDLGRALSGAQAQAVQLRRKLTGIAD